MMPDHPADKGGTGFRILAAAVCTAIAVLLVLSVLDEVRFASERIGVYLDEHEQGILIDGVEPDMPAERAGVKGGDVLIRIEGEKVTDFESLNRLADAYFKPREPLHFAILRDGRELEMQLTPGTVPDVASLLAQLVLVAAYLGLAILAAQYRHRDIRARLLMIFVALIAVELAIPRSYSFEPVLYFGLDLYFYLAVGAQIAVELHLVSLIPGRLNILRRRPRLVYAYYAAGGLVALILVALAVYSWLHGGILGLPLLDQTFQAIFVGWAAVIPLILLWQIWHAGEPRGRNQALLVLIGLLPWVVFVFVSSFWPGWEGIDLRWASHIQNLVLLFFPAAIFVAIFRYGLFDVEHLVRRGMVYGVVAALILILIYTLLTTALPWISERIGDEAGLLLITAMAVITGILFRPLRYGVERLVERGFFPERHALRRELIRFAGSLSQEEHMNALVARLADATRDAFGLHWAAVVAIEGPDRRLHTAFSEGIDNRDQQRLRELLNTDSITFASLANNHRPISVRRFARRQPHAAQALKRIGADVLVPLYFQRRMIGILCLSGKTSGELFMREELELLDLFSHQIATSFENLRLFQDANYDELTGLLRREAAIRQFQAECGRAVRDATPLSVFMIDLDHFKAINDEWGHLFGDRILTAVAQTMNKRIRAVDALGRYGGEEFFLVLPETGSEGAGLVAEELRDAVSSLEFRAPDDHQTVQVTISIGIATSSPRQVDAIALEKELLEQADAAVYQAKHEGRNRIVFHDASE